jgi:hypothetical protein
LAAFDYAAALAGIGAFDLVAAGPLLAALDSATARSAIAAFDFVVAWSLLTAFGYANWKSLRMHFRMPACEIALSFDACE